jgi:hypothetical protein
MTLRRSSRSGIYRSACNACAVCIVLAGQRVGAAEDAALVLIDRDLLLGVVDKMPVQGWDQDEDEARAYNYVLVKVSRTPVEALARNARADLTYAHLMEEPSKYRGALVHFEGRLRKLVQYDAPKLAAAEGVAQLYEAWIFGTTHYSNPMCVLFTELPPGLRPGEKLDRWVAFDAFFFKRYRYRAVDAVRDAPLLMGRAPRAPATPAATTEPTVSEMLTGFVAFGAGTVALVVLLAWWFRRSDQRIHSTLARAQMVSPFPPDGEGPDSLSP